MSYLGEDFGRQRPGSSTPIVGSPNYGGGYFDGVAQSYRSNQFNRPPSPSIRNSNNRINSNNNPKPNDGPPLLKRHKVEFTPDEPITHLTVGTNHVIIAMKDKKVISIDTMTGKQTDCDLARCLGNKLLQARLHKMFVDPTGRFTLISMAYASDNQPMENLLFVKRVQPLPKLKNHLISAVAWNHPRINSGSNSGNGSNSTGTILLGTTKGLILQTEFIHSDETKFFPISTGPNQYVREVFNVGPEVGAISGIEYHQISSPDNSTNERYFVIIVSTNTRLYRMVGSVLASVDPPPLHQIFAQNSSNYQDVPGRINNAKLDFYYPTPNSPPNRFAWLTEPGVMTSEIPNQYSACAKAFESNEGIDIVPYNITRDYDQLSNSSPPIGMSPPIATMNANYNDKPLSVVVSDFHVIVLFRLCLRAICILNNATVYEEYFPIKHGNVETMKYGSFDYRYGGGGNAELKYGNIQGMCKDPIKNIIWIYFENAISKYKISNESKNVWKIYLNQEKFDLAKKYSIKDPNNYDRVICEEAQYYFNRKDYEKSAEIFARSRRPFEEVSLMYMETKCTKALKKYLTMKLEQFETPKQSTQLTMVLAWLFEIIISSIGVLKTAQLDDDSEELDDLHTELEQILEIKQVIDCIKQHSSLFYGIIRNYSDLETFVRVAKLIGDFDQVLQYYVDVGEFNKALDIMKAIKREDYFYSYGHILMKRMPKELIDVVIEQPSINPTKLIPVLIQENPYFNKCSETIRYLEFCVNILKTDSKVVHNYLFELYARHRDEDTLINYLESEVEIDQQTFLDVGVPQQTYLDLQLCLRLCTDMKLTKTCVVLYSSMGLYDEAVHLALGFDVELAKGIAKKVMSEDHQKRLWLVIAENILTENLDIQVATNLLHESKLLKIEDILPFFPDYTTIDFFRDAIRQSLQEYRQQILQHTDGTYDSIAGLIRNEIKAFRNRYSIVKVGQKCQICAKNLLSRTFYVFPCGHLFHNDCIEKEITTIDPQYKDHPQLDTIISSECIYCGNILPSYIDKPPPADFDLLDTDNL